MLKYKLKYTAKYIVINRNKQLRYCQITEHTRNLDVLFQHAVVFIRHANMF